MAADSRRNYLVKWPAPASSGVYGPIRDQGRARVFDPSPDPDPEIGPKDPEPTPIGDNKDVKKVCKLCTKKCKLCILKKVKFIRFLRIFFVKK